MNPKQFWTYAKKVAIGALYVGFVGNNAYLKTVAMLNPDQRSMRPDEIALIAPLAGLDADCGKITYHRGVRGTGIDTTKYCAVTLGNDIYFRHDQVDENFNIPLDLQAHEDTHAADMQRGAVLPFVVGVVDFIKEKGDYLKTYANPEHRPFWRSNHEQRAKSVETLASLLETAHKAAADPETTAEALTSWKIFVTGTAETFGYPLSPQALSTLDEQIAKAPSDPNKEIDTPFMRHLSEFEIAVAHGLYGDQIDYSNKMVCYTPFTVAHENKENANPNILYIDSKYDFNQPMRAAATITNMLTRAWEVENPILAAQYKTAHPDSPPLPFLVALYVENMHEFQDLKAELSQSKQRPVSDETQQNLAHNYRSMLRNGKELQTSLPMGGLAEVERDYQTMHARFQQNKVSGQPTTQTFATIGATVAVNQP